MSIIDLFAIATLLASMLLWSRGYYQTTACILCLAWQSTPNCGSPDASAFATCFLFLGFFFAVGFGDQFSKNDAERAEKALSQGANNNEA